MAEDLTLVKDLAVVLVTAGIVALGFHLLRLPAILGYLVAGVLVAHASPVPLIGNAADISALAQLGIVFLLFGLGLDFHLGRLRRVGGLALTAGTLETALMVGVGFVVGRALGWSLGSAFVLGAILAISSTTLVVKTLQDLGRAGHGSSEVIFGILLVEDLVAIVLLAMLPTATTPLGVAAVGSVALKIALFAAVALVLGLAVVPRVVDKVATMRVEAILVLLVVGIAFAVSMSAVALGLSVALGAFIAGAIVAESRAAAAVEHRIAPLRDVFTAVFFVSTGILLDPATLLAHWQLVVLLAGVTLVGKVVAVSGATFIAGYPATEALRVGIGMAMIGEFSFVIAAQTSPAFLLPIAVGVSALTTLATPFLVRRSDVIIRGASRAAPAGVRDFAATYSAWAQRARRRRGGREAFEGGLRRADVARAAVFVLLLAFTGIAAAFMDGRLAAGGVAYAWRIASIAAFALLGVVMLVGLARAARTLVRHLSEAIIPPEQASGAGAAAAAVLRRTLYVFLALLTGAVLFAAGAAFVPPLPLLAGALVLVAFALLILRGAIRRLDRQISQALDVVLEGDEEAPGTRDKLLALIRAQSPWDMHAQSLIVSPGARAASKRIRDLQLPQKTGAAIVTHERAGRSVLNPPADLMIEPGDILGILGSREQVEKARRLLTGEDAMAQRPAG
ncbi:MAG: monovalent cation:H+ antiporter-2, family, partial [Thermoplasmata archaeon]|nr:monovalent cation:H+ antiporter-2, family [Thermoplasmata archaeon]